MSRIIQLFLRTYTSTRKICARVYFMVLDIAPAHLHMSAYTYTHIGRHTRCDLLCVNLINYNFYTNQIKIALSFLCCRTSICGRKSSSYDRVGFYESLFYCLAYWLGWSVENLSDWLLLCVTQEMTSLSLSHAHTHIRERLRFVIFAP